MRSTEGINNKLCQLSQYFRLTVQLPTELSKLAFECKPSVDLFLTSTLLSLTELMVNKLEVTFDVPCTQQESSSNALQQGQPFKH